MSKNFKLTLASMFVAAFAFAGSASAATATFTTNMTVGSKGAEVKALQVFLNQCPATALAVPAGSAGSTGYESMTFGPATKAAVMSWQAANGVNATGYFGPMSRAAAASVGNNCGSTTTSTTTTTTTTTGTTSTVAGCTSTSGFSPVTGASCSTGATTTTLPNGCTSTSGFSPVTGASCSTGATTTGPAVMTGTGEGNISSLNKLGLYNTTKVNEGGVDTKVYAMEMIAKDGDQKIDSFTVSFANVQDSSTSTQNGSRKFGRYATDVSIWLDGTEIGRKLASEFSDDASDVYVYRFTGMNGVVKQNMKANLVVAVSGTPSMDSTDATYGDFRVVAGTASISGMAADNTDGVLTGGSNFLSAVSANGRFRDYGSALSTSTIDFQKATGDATYKVSTSTTNPIARVVQVSKTSDTNDAVLVAFDVKAENVDMLLQKLPVSVSTSGTLAQVAKNLKLYANGTLVTSETPAATTTFGSNTKMNYKIAANTTVKFEVRADLNSTATDYSNYANGTTISASVTGSLATVELDNANRDTVTNMTGSATGELQTLQTKGIKVSLVSTSATTSPIGTSGDINGNFAITFKVDAIDEDILIDASTATQLAATANPTVAGQGVIVAVGGNVAALTDVQTNLTTVGILESSTTNTLDSTGNYFYVTNGQSRTFTVKYENLLPTANGNKNVEFLLRSINWVTYSDATNATLGDLTTGVATADFSNYYTSGFSDFKTGQKNLVNA